VTTWYAITAIKGTPQPIVDRMYQEVAKALQSPEIKEIWAGQGATAGGMPPAEFGALVKQEVARWGKVVKEAGVKADL
jgi:tripartite-type tricarboxylate transporter receptor subunit TctC